MRGLSLQPSLQPRAVPGLGAGGADPNIANVVLLAGFDRAGTANRTAYTEESSSAHVLSFSGSGTTGTYPTGGKFDGRFLSSSNTHYASAPDSPDWHFGAGNWTIETFINYTNAPGTGDQGIMGQWRASGANRSWLLLRSGGALTLLLSTTGSNTIASASAAWAPTTGVDYHVAADFDGTAYRIYVDGVMLAKEVAAHGALADITIPMTLGAWDSGGGIEGSMDECRITKGVARYASDSGYTVPTAKFPRP